MKHLLSVLVYIIFLALVLWGGKLPGKEERFHRDPVNKDATEGLRGLAAIGVILHHISQETAMQSAGELSAFVSIGFFFVAVFFFCSGYGLVKSFDTRENYLDGFLRKRLPVILVPYYVSCVCYLLFRLFVLKETMETSQIICSLLGLVMVNEYAWYPVVLAVLYLSFYAAFKLVKNRKAATALVFLVVLLMGVGFCVNGHFAWWSREGTWWKKPLLVHTAKWWMKEKVLLFSGEWWVNSPIAFAVGMVVANHEEELFARLKKGYWWKLLLTAGLFWGAHSLSAYAQGHWGYWSEFSGRGPHIGDKLITLALQLPEVVLFVCVLAMLLPVFRTGNPVTRFFNRLSQETYLMNLMALQLFRFFLYDAQGNIIAKAGDVMLFYFALCSFAGTLLLAFPFKGICGLIIRRLQAKKKV